jgi:hypothetical protein
MNRHACCFSSNCCCCVHACVRGCLRDRHHISDDTSAQTRAWRIDTVSRAFVRVHSSRIFLYENSILHARRKCTFVVGRPNIPAKQFVIFEYPQPTHRARHGPNHNQKFRSHDDEDDGILNISRKEHHCGALLKLGACLRRLVAQPAKDTCQPRESLDQHRLLSAATSVASCCL